MTKTNCLRYNFLKSKNYLNKNIRWEENHVGPVVCEILSYAHTPHTNTDKQTHIILLFLQGYYY